MLCDVGSSLTTCNGWFARTAKTCGIYMQPFCSTTTGCVGGSNVRSPNPSATNTITFCRSPFESVITSCAKTGEECCLAQLGSAAMLISLGLGVTPSNRTVPFTLEAPAALTLGGAPPAFATRVTTTQIAREKKIDRERADRESNFRACITQHLNSVLLDLRF